MPYEINTDQFYKIWFSKNPAQALGIENELALVRLRDKHPQADISFVYSASCLYIAAKVHLYAFCKKYHINLFDFDTDLNEAITSMDHIDRLLYEIAKKEIQCSVSDIGGNLAAASDITRLLEPVIQLGIYSDFDVDLDFCFIEPVIQCESPIIIQATTEPSIGINNEFFAIAKTEAGEIHPDAKQKLTKLKTNIMENYSNVEKALCTPFLVGGKSSLEKDSMLLMPVQSFFKKYPQATIFEFRQYVQQLTLSQLFLTLPATRCELILKQSSAVNLTEEEIGVSFGQFIKKIKSTAKADSAPIETKSSSVPMEIHEMSELDTAKKQLIIYKHILYNNSVTQITGPATLKYLIDRIDKFTLPQSQSDRKKLISIINTLSVQHSPFLGCVFSKNSLDELKKHDGPGKTVIDLVGLVGHQSWNAMGAQRKAERENKMDKAVRILQAAFKKYKAKRVVKKMKRTVRVGREDKSKKFRK